MLASHKGEIPFVVFILPFLAGIVLALSVNLSGYQTLLICCFAILLTGFIGLNIFYKKAEIYRKQWIGGLLMNGLLLLAGVIAVVNYDSRNRDTYFEKLPADMLLVKVSNEPQLKGHFLRFTAETEQGTGKGTQQAASGTLLLILPVDSSKPVRINYGDELLITAKYNAIDPPFNPAEFNYKQYLVHQNIYAQAFLNSREVVALHTNAGNALVAYSLKLRQQLVKQFKVYLHSPEAVSVASTLILGYKAELDNDILQAYSKTGTIHVLSVSGAHVAIIFYLISLMLGFLDRCRYGKLLKAVLSIMLIWYYSLLTGLSPAVCRAAVMISLIIIGKTYNRRINNINILAVSAFSILLFNPFLITDVGFQLSYLAVGGLIVFQPIVYRWLDIDNKWLDKLWLVCSASIAAQVITFPLSAYYFHQFPVYFLVSNLFILVPSFVIIYAGIACLLFAQSGIGVLAKLAGYVLEKSILVMDRGLQWIEHSPYASVSKIWITRTEYVLLFTVIILLFCLCYYKKTIFLKAALVVVLILSLSLSIKRISGIRSDHITFFNLKKHSGILFKQGDKAILLTDLADTDKTYRYSIQPCLDSSRINNLTVIPFTKDIANAFLHKQGHLVRFIDRDVLIFDQAMDNAPPAKIQADYLFATDNPHADIDEHYNYHLLIADANNSDATLKRLLSAVFKYHKKIYTLRRNKSLIIQSDMGVGL